MTFAESIDVAIKHFNSLSDTDRELIDTACPSHASDRERIIFLHGFNLALTVLTSRFPNLSENQLVTYDITSVLGAVASKLSDKSLKELKEHQFRNFYEV